MNSELLRKILRQGYFHINEKLLARFEQFSFSSDEPGPKHPPIFILGAPRCGSTLLFQSISASFEFSFFTNLHHRLYGAPYLAEHIAKTLRSSPSGNFQSSFGDVEGVFGASEGGAWWYRFFPLEPVYVTPDDARPESMLGFRRSISKLINTAGRPVLFKNLYAAMRLHAIVHNIPESIFIVVHRDENDIGHSLLEARKKVLGSYDEWFSLPTVDVEQLKKLPPSKQVIEQVRQIYKTINTDLRAAKLPSNQRFDICYEDFCADPSKTMNDLVEYFCSIGLDFKKRKVSFPSSFSKRQEVRIDHGIYNEMVEYARSTS